MDSIRNLTREYRASKWAETIKACRNSGISIRAWCAEHGINEKSFYYWQRRFREQICHVVAQNTAAPLTTFAEINITPPIKSETVAVTIKIGETSAEIHNGANPETIEHVIRTLKLLC